MKKNESTRTIAYVVVAAVSIGLALVLSPPGEITPKELIDKKVGAPFFENFTNPNDATSIKVASWNEASATPKHFAVSFVNGKWTIPTHHNYPADGEDRLAKTATSVRGIKREELAGESKQSHEQFGVIDPEDKDRSELKGRGQKLTLQKGEDTLVDLIIGKQLKDRPGYYYVRRSGEDATFVAKLDINLSTKFGDWIETDLLKLNRDDLKQIVIDNYSIDKTQGLISKGEISKLDRDKSTDPWKLDGLDETQEEVDTAKMNAMVGALDDLKIVGVRPKPPGFKPDLSLDRTIVKKQDELNRLLRDLSAAGFAFSKDPETEDVRLYSVQGDLIAATNKGVRYILRFGDVFLGDETEIEIGGTGDNAAEKKDGEKTDAEKKEGEDDNAKPDSKDSPGKQSSRYLFVTVSFDESILGPRPEKPERPDELAVEDKKPARKKSATAKPSADESTTDKADGDSSPAPEKKSQEQKSQEQPPQESPDKKPADELGDRSAQGTPKIDDNCLRNVAGDDEPEQKPDAKPGAKPDAPADDAPKADDKPAAKPETKPESPDEPQDEPEVQPEPKKSKADLKKEYDAQVRKYNDDLKAFDDKVAAGKKQVDELNARFAGWYYVISADYFNKLHLARKELVREKSKTGDVKPGIPGFPSQEGPEGPKPSDEEDDPDFKDK